MAKEGNKKNTFTVSKASPALYKNKDLSEFVIPIETFECLNNLQKDKR